ncbi:MAG: hypothetical protein AAFX50_25225, partial [Acidobacteriota bacterium]
MEGVLRRLPEGFLEVMEGLGRATAVEQKARPLLEQNGERMSAALGPQQFDGFTIGRFRIVRSSEARQRPRL